MKPIAVRVRRLLRNGQEGHKMDGLYRPVFHGGDAQRPEIAVLLGNVNPAKRQSTVIPALQQRHGGPLSISISWWRL